MYEDSLAELQMTEMVLEEGFFDPAVYECKVVSYHPDEEFIYLLSEETKLPVFSLDAIYELRIREKESIIRCNGFIRERYWNKLGKILVFKIKAGFYKKVLN